MWEGDRLVDWVAGGREYRLDGSTSVPRFEDWDTFDAATSSADGKYIAVYRRLGTHGLLLRRGEVLRELSRHAYRAEAFDYPICFTRHGQRDLLFHCPEIYGRIEIEDAATGERLTSRQTKATDYFHSRLAANLSGTRLITAGWVWQPWNAVCFYSIGDALADPTHLDSHGWHLPHTRHVCLAEEDHACWQSDTTAIISATDEPEDPEEATQIDGARLRPRGVSVVDVASNEILSSVVLEEPAGTIMPIGASHALGFYRHPRLIRLQDGEVELELSHLDSGLHQSSITWGRNPPPRIAFDPERSRFAIAQHDGIHVVTLHLG